MQFLNEVIWVAIAATIGGLIGSVIIFKRPVKKETSTDKMPLPKKKKKGRVFVNDDASYIRRMMWEEEKK